MLDVLASIEAQALYTFSNHAGEHDRVFMLLECGCHLSLSFVSWSPVIDAYQRKKWKKVIRHFLAFIFHFPNDKPKRKLMFEFSKENSFPAKTYPLSLNQQLYRIYEQYQKFIYNTIKTSLSSW